MKRRDLIKSGLLAAGAVTVGAIGNQKLNKNNSNNAALTITPKQTGVYDIYTPLPFRFDLIDELAELNSKLKKSQIRTLYNNIPLPLASVFEEQFQGPKGKNPTIKSFDDFAKPVKYAQSLGFKFEYVLNSPKPFSFEDYKKHKAALDKLLDDLEKIGCKEIKIANQQLMEIISKERPNFTLSASTSFEYHNVSQYKNLLSTYPAIKSINTAIDDNRNFIFLKNLRKLFPDIDIKIMANERCVHGCPARISHAASYFVAWDCKELFYKKLGKIKSFCKGNMIHPWQLEYYSAIGINSFKFLSPLGMRANIPSILALRSYLECVEYGVDNLKASDFFHNIYVMNVDIKNDIPLAELITYLPDIKHFVKHGDQCANICESECHYCLKCAEEIEKVLGIS